MDEAIGIEGGALRCRLCGGTGERRIRIPKGDIELLKKAVRVCPGEPLECDPERTPLYQVCLGHSETRKFKSKEDAEDFRRQLIISLAFHESFYYQQFLEGALALYKGD